MRKFHGISPANLIWFMGVLWTWLLEWDSSWKIICWWEKNHGTIVGYSPCIWFLNVSENGVYPQLTCSNETIKNNIWVWGYTIFRQNHFGFRVLGQGFKCGLDDEHLLQYLDVVLCCTVCFLGHKPFKIWLENKTHVAFCKHMGIGMAVVQRWGLLDFMVTLIGKLKIKLWTQQPLLINQK